MKLAVVVLSVVAATAAAARPRPTLRPNGSGGFDLSPSTNADLGAKAREDTDNWVYALDRVAPGGTIRLDAGLFLIDHTLYGANVQATIRGAGSGRTIVRAYAPPGGVFQTGAVAYDWHTQPPPAEMLNLGIGTATDLLYPSLFLFTESDYGPAGQPVVARSTKLTLAGMTLDSDGLTDAPPLVGTEGGLVALLQVLGKDYRWFEPRQALTPDDTAFAPGWSVATPIDGPGAGGPRFNEISHAELKVADVIMRGTNGRGSQVRLGILSTGGTEFVAGNLARKPINLVAEIRDSQFIDLHDAVDLPSNYSPSQRAWSFTPDATAARIVVEGNLFQDVTFTAFADDPGDASIRFTDNVVANAFLGPYYSGTWPYNCLNLGWFPKVTVRSRVLVAGNSLDELDGERALLADECDLDHPTLDWVVRDNDVHLAGTTGTAIWSYGTAGATIRGNRISGSGDAAIRAISSEDWDVRQDGLAAFAATTADIDLDGTNDSTVVAPGAIVLDHGANNVIRTR